MQAPDFRLDGKVALITGAARGIGMGIAKGLASAGCAVAIQDIDVPVAQSLADEMIAQGGRAIALGGDITDLALPQRLVEQTVGGLGGIHILVNNASIQRWVNWMDVSPREMEEKYRANLIVPMLLTRLAVPHFKSAGYGRVINLGSLHQRRGYRDSLTYSTTKAALWNLTRTLAAELAPLGVTMNMISPGYFNTYRNRDEFRTPEETASRGKHIPLRRVGEPQDCAGAALLLASAAGEYITGQCLYIDGGISA